MGFLTAVKETFGGDAEVGGENESERERPASTAESVIEASPAVQCASEADLVVATGQTRKETLVELVEAHDGRVKQVELVDLTGWSKSTVSRHLGELENDGAIDRVPVGRCKVVLLPDESLLSERSISYDTRG